MPSHHAVTLRPRSLPLLAAAALLTLVGGCSGAGGTSAGGGAAGGQATASSSTGAGASTGASTTGTTQAPALVGAPVPVIFVHGITSDPVENWGALLPRLARGRQVFPEIYAAETDQLPTGGVRPDSLFAFGFYRESAASPKYYADRHPRLSSIGGCPVPRTDPHAAQYTTSYAAQLDRAVENVCRATGSERVDLVCYSLGGIVGRAYTRWLSLKAPGGGSRVRRLLTVGTMNHGLNSLEATTLVIAKGSAGPHLAQGEAAEINNQCDYWGGRSFIDHLDDGWDAFCAQSGIAYAAGYGTGNSIFDSALLQHIMTTLGQYSASIMTALLVHPTPTFDIAAAGQEAMGDGDGVVRAASSRMDPGHHPGVRFNATYYGTHALLGDEERTLYASTWMEELVRAFIFDGRASGAALAGTGAVRAVSGAEASWIALEVDVTAGDPLAAQALLRTKLGQFLVPFAPTFGVGTHAFGLPLRPGTQRLMLDPAGIPDGEYRCEVRLFGLEGTASVAPVQLRIDRAGKPAAPSPSPTIGTPTANVAGGVDVPVSVDPSSGELLWALDDGSGASWSAPTAPGLLSLTPLAPGSYELQVRAMAAPNAAGISVESARPATVRLVKDAAGTLSVHR